jgi:hypothetical protein
MSKDETPYEVGYGKPPASGKFAKGQSGNPKGRSKGSKHFASVVLQEAASASGSTALAGLARSQNSRQR